MKEKLVKFRNFLIRNIYKTIIRPILFKIDPESVHNYFIFFGRILGSNSFTRDLTRLLFDYSHPLLERTILGIHFKNPIGLSAGFDKNAQLIKIIPNVGFGYMEIGSITGEACKGNEKPRLWRHPKLKSIRVNYGLMNDGSESIAKKLGREKTQFPFGINIAKTNIQETCETDLGIQDYIKSFNALKNIGSYITVNLSCPNTFGGQPFTDSVKLDKLLSKIDEIQYAKPIFLKLSPDLSINEVDKILTTAQKHRIHGFICSNLSKKHNFGKGGLSGKILNNLSLQQIRHINKITKGQLIIIASGGIFSVKDALEYFDAGASLLQLITGMIYEGPQLISEINQGLVEKWKKIDIKA